MNLRTWWRAAALCGVLAAAGLSVAQDKKTPAKDDKKPAAGQAGELPPEFAAWLQFSAPDEHHKTLDVLAGQWNQTIKHQMNPQAPAQECKGTAKYHWILGGRFLVEEVGGEMMGERFEGFAIHGYDRQKQKYTSIWMDSMGTMMMQVEGTADASGKTITYAGEYDCPLTKSRKKMKTVLKLESRDKVILEMYDTGPDGKEFKNMEIVSTRATQS